MICLRYPIAFFSDSSARIRCHAICTDLVHCYCHINENSIAATPPRRFCRNFFYILQDIGTYFSIRLQDTGIHAKLNACSLDEVTIESKPYYVVDGTTSIALCPVRACHCPLFAKRCVLCLLCILLDRPCRFHQKRTCVAIWRARQV